MKKFISASLAAVISLSSIPAQAGFLSQFFANVASDSLQDNGRRYSADPLLKEKKVQGALAVMGFYQGKLDGDFDTFDSRVGIKKFQKSYGLDETGFLSDEEKSQLTYLSNLYTELQKEGVDKPKKVAIYDEIDEAQKSMKKESLLGSFFSADKYKLRVVSELEDASVYLNKNKVGTIQLGYFTALLDAGEYDVKTLKQDEHFDFSAEKKITVDNKDAATVFYAKEDKKANQKTLKIASNLGISNYPVEGVFVDFANNNVWENTSSTLKSPSYTWYQAKDYCENLTISSYANWRLASIEELHSLYKTVNENRTQETANIQKKYNYNHRFGIWSNHTKIESYDYKVTYGYNAYDGRKSSSFVIYSEDPYSSKTKDDYNKTQVICILDN